MGMQQNKSHQPSDDDMDQMRVVDADADPKANQIERMENESAAEIAFAEAAAEFARHEYDVGGDLIKEGKAQDGAELRRDATRRMNDAAAIMAQADEHEKHAEKIREVKRRELSRELRDWSDQSLLTLRDAVSEVRAYVEQMTDLDIRKVLRASDLSDDDIAQKRDIIIEYGQTIEISLNSVEQARHDPYTLVRHLVTFTTIALELARYLPPLMEKMNEFGRLLLQFHF